MAKDYSNIKGLTGNVKESIKNAYDKGYKQGLNDGRLEINTFVEAAYEKGLNDAWKCTKKINKMDYKTRREVLGVDYEHDMLRDIINIFSVSEAIAKIKEYEEKQKQANDEIKVGDEVYLSSLSKDYPRIVLSLYAEDDGLGLKARTMLPGGTIDIKPISELKQTGRHFNQIAEVLEQLKEVSNNG